MTRRPLGLWILCVLAVLLLAYFLNSLIASGLWLRHVPEMDRGMQGRIPGYIPTLPVVWNALCVAILIWLVHDLWRLRRRVIVAYLVAIVCLTVVPWTLMVLSYRRVFRDPEYPMLPAQMPVPPEYLVIGGVILFAPMVYLLLLRRRGVLS